MAIAILRASSLDDSDTQQVLFWNSLLPSDSRIYGIYIFWRVDAALRFVFLVISFYIPMATRTLSSLDVRFGGLLRH